MRSLRAVAVVLFLLVVPVVQAVIEDDFNDDTIGLTPVTPGIIWGGGAVASTCPGGLDDGGGDVCVNLGVVGFFELEGPGPVTSINFTMHLPGSGSTPRMVAEDSVGNEIFHLALTADGAPWRALPDWDCAGTFSDISVSGAGLHQIRIEFQHSGGFVQDFQIYRNDVLVRDGSPTKCDNPTDVAKIKNSANALTYYLDDLRLEGVDVPLPPLAPAGLSAVVVNAKDTADPGEEGEVELRWPVSSDDPDQDQGDYAYEVYLDGIFIGDDAKTGVDGDGARFHSVIIGGNEVGGPTTFSVKARNETTDFTSPFSCSVNVDTSVVGDRDSCGSGAPGGSGISFTTPTDTAAGLSGFCTDLMGDSEASKFLCGLILVVIVFLGVGAGFAAMAGAPGMPAVIAGSIGAFGMMIFLVVAQIWSLGAAAIIILLSTGVALALMRRLFFGGGSGS